MNNSIKKKSVTLGDYLNLIRHEPTDCYTMVNTANETFPEGLRLYFVPSSTLFAEIFKNNMLDVLEKEIECVFTRIYKEASDDLNGIEDRLVCYSLVHGAYIDKRDEEGNRCERHIPTCIEIRLKQNI